ncbi:hypothetical protein [Streptomyces mobaraensis]|uniref:Uncharacterized protein n=1 Tax=Streptomyces mobaraensis TaxID=35621 RepID=A0A5N5VZ84_STRMB|nr:hypothetical protein [Streptomyces mobaraensis]KAB7834254.1 hypothetical protein FRZ00_30065 [Streptomyces mobaraensis]
MDETTYLTDELRPVAEWVGEDVSDLVKKYEAAVAEHPEPRFVEVARAEPDTRGAADFHKEYNLTIVPRVLVLRVSVDAQTGADWHAKVEVTPTVFGYKLKSSGFELSRLNSSITIHPAISVAGADLTLGFYGPKLCFGVSGDVWYWALKKHKKPIDASNLFCLM